MRKYQPIWEAIKKESKVSLAADPSLHARIIKAVIKEKLIDAGWHLLMSEAGKKYKLKEETNGKMITLSLIDISPLRVTDL